MKKEDLEFLKELQHELKTQESDGQAEPRYWGVSEKIENPSPLSIANHLYIYHEGEQYTKNDILEILEEDINDEGSIYHDCKEDFDKLDTTNIEDVKDFFDDMYGTESEIVGTIEIRRISQDTGSFLTKRAAQKHIELNGYHYNDPHTYAMTAWRNPEFERFLKIFEEMDLNKIEVNENE